MKSLVKLEIFTISIFICTFGSAFAAPKMYIFSGTITDKGGRWDLWDHYGFPSVSVGDHFVGSMFYSFDVQPNIEYIDPNYTVYYGLDTRFSTSIFFNNFYVQANYIISAYHSSDRTIVGFTTGSGHYTSFYNFEPPPTYFAIDTMDLGFKFSESIPGNGFPSILDTSLSNGGGLSIGWYIYDIDVPDDDITLSGRIDYVSSVGGCIEDYDLDHDVDGLDLNHLVDLINSGIPNPENEISNFAMYFGQTYCN